MARSNFSGWGLGEYDDYNPYTLFESNKINALRAEYARLRKIANKRIAELEGVDRYAASEFVQKVFDGFQYSATATKQELAQRLTDVADFLHSQRSTVGGYREFEMNIQKKFKEATGVEVDLEDVLDLREFMKELREKGVFRMYDSADAVSWFEQYSETRGARDTGEAVSKFMREFRTWQRGIENGI